MNAQYTAAGEWVTPERVDAIRADGRRQVLDIVHDALPSADANYIESRVREVTTTVAPAVLRTDASCQASGIGGTPAGATAAAARAQQGPERVQRTG